jgi:hypothetical protein
MLQEAPGKSGASFETPLTRLLRMRAGSKAKTHDPVNER